MVLSRNKLAKGFTGVLYRFSTVRKMSVTDDITDWSLPTKLLAALLSQGKGLVMSELQAHHCIAPDQ